MQSAVVPDVQMQVRGARRPGVGWWVAYGSLPSPSVCSIDGDTNESDGKGPRRFDDGDANEPQGNRVSTTIFFYTRSQGAEI